MMFVVYSKTFEGWVVCELRQIAGRIEKVPISVPYKQEDEEIQAMHHVSHIRLKVRMM